MCSILLSINPKYVEEILLGNKKYEYRTRIAKRKVDKILIYCTNPVKKIVAEVEVLSIISDEPTRLWERTKDHSGIKDTFYNKYFSENKVAYAYELGEIKEYDEPKELSYYGIRNAPQSFIYLD